MAAALRIGHPCSSFHTLLLAAFKLATKCWAHKTRNLGQLSSHLRRMIRNSKHIVHIHFSNIPYEQCYCMGREVENQVQYNEFKMQLFRKLKLVRFVMSILLALKVPPATSTTCYHHDRQHDHDYHHHNNNNNNGN